MEGSPQLRAPGLCVLGKARRPRFSLPRASPHSGGVLTFALGRISCRFAVLAANRSGGLSPSGSVLSLHLWGPCLLREKVLNVLCLSAKWVLNEQGCGLEGWKAAAGAWGRPCWGGERRRLLWPSLRPGICFAVATWPPKGLKPYFRRWGDLPPRRKHPVLQSTKYP